MGRLTEPVGRYAEHPYYIAQTDTSVYCVEELCFTLCQNTFLLDRGLLDLKLAKWLDEECGLRELARPLYGLINQNGSPSAFVGIILEYTHYGTEKKRQETEELLRIGADMDVSTRRKHFADYLVGNGRYAQAVMEYEKVLEEIPSMNYVMRSELLHNKGVALCRLFSFAEAAEAFLLAYQENPAFEEAALSYLAALRMTVSEEEYITFIAEHPMWHEQSLEVEKRLEKSRIDYENSEEYKKLTGVLERRDTEYYKAVSEKLTQMQRDYRKMVEQS
ncbi:MAG: hypothetical protein HFI10_07080 [Lachnospiraceae bacterium]|jgi:tetratricopeptide (TPR) repeat protein|nr:hypothetical protein [Lachnospiraceae bacterium]